ncbi:type I secretion C-terminal target domain-containing protein, partial [Vogesella sp. LYT5W]
LTYTVSLVDSDGKTVALPAGKEVTLNLAWSGAAANDGDTGGRPATVTLGADGTASFSVDAKDDYLQEGSEGLVATLTGAASNTAFETIAISDSKGSASSVVTDESGDPQDPQNPLDGVTAQIVVDQASVAEGGQLTYTVSLVDSDGKTVTLPEGKEVTLNLAWSGAAANDGDTAGRPATVTIGANGTASFSVDAKDDYLQEGSEGLVATLTGAASNTAFETIAISDSKGSASSVVTDESGDPQDPQNPLDGVTAQILVDQANVAEGGQLTYTVSLVDSDGKTVTLPEGKEVTLNLAWSGAAANDGDTAGRPATVTIGANGTASFSVDAKDDYLQEGSEGLVATITGAASNTAFEQIDISDSKGSASSVVTDEAIPGPEDTVLISLSGPGSVLEGEATASYSINLSQKAETDVTVTLNYSGTASDGSDYIKQIEVKIPAGADHAEFNLSTLDDAIADNGETIIVTLGQATGGGFEAIAANPAQSSVTTTIVDETGNDPEIPGDNDSAFSLKLFAANADGSLLSGDSSVSEEGETSAYYVVRAVDAQGKVLTTQPDGTVSVSFGNLGSTSSSDYSAGKTTVAVGEVFSAKAVNDALADNGEQFQVSLNAGSYSAAANYEKVEYNSATVTTTIVDQDIVVALQEVVEGSAGNVLNVASGVEFVGQTQLGGTVSLNAAGQYVYQAPVRDHSDSASDVDSFSYTKADGSTATYTINILDTNPLAANDSGTVNTGLNVQTAGSSKLLANDSVVDSSAANAAKVYTVTGENGVATALSDGEVTVAGKYGELTVKADGSYIYTSKLDTDISAAEGAAALKASFGVYGFQDGSWQTGGGLNLSGLTANASALVDVRTSGGNAKPGIGVSQGGSGTNDIGGGETLVIGLKVASSFVQIGINELNKGQGDASWKAYDANGNLVDSGTLVSTSSNGSLQSFNISTTTAFKYVVLGYSGNQNGYVIDSIKYTPADGAVTETFSYTVQDNDGDVSNTATLTLNGTQSTTVSPTALLTTEDTDVALNWAVLGISDAGATVRVSGNQNGNGTIQYKDANGVFKVLGQNETSTFSKSDIDAGKVKFVPKEHVSGADLYGDNQGIGNKGKDLGSIKFDVLKNNVEIAHGKEVAVDVVPVADKPLLSLSAYQSLAAMDFDGVNLAGEPWSSAIDLNTVGGASGIGTWQANGWGKIEVGKESVYIPGGSGTNQVLEIEGDKGVSQIYTDIQCEAGRFYQLNFDVGARSGRPVETCGMKILLVQLDAGGNPIAGSQKELFDFSPTQLGWAKGQQLSLGIEQSGGYRLIFQSKDAGDSYGAILDNIKFQAVDNKGYEDSFIKLSAINAALVDVDGSETLSVVISGLPAGAVLKDAANHGATVGPDGTLDVSGWSLSSLQIKVNEPGQYNLLVKATATEVDASGKVLDTEESEITLPVEVLKLNVAPVETTLPSQADDSTVIEGSTTSYGSILANDGITGEVSKLYVSLDGGSTKVEVAAGGTELDTGHGTVTIRPDGSYTFVAKVVDHTGDADNKVSDSFSYKAVTANGETAWTAVSVAVLDTNPVAVDDYAAGSAADTKLSGNVLDNDAAVDSDKSVTGFSYMGKDYAAGETTADGRFTLNTDGSYTLKALTAMLNVAPTEQQLASGKVGSFELTGLNSAPPERITSFSAGQNLGYNSSGAASGKVGWSVDAAHDSRHTVDGGETLLVKLGGIATQVTLTIAELNAGTARLVAYDAAGNKVVLVDDTITSDEVGKNGKPGDFTATSKDGTAIAYMAMTYEGTSSDTGKGKDDSQGFLLKGMSYTELLKPASIEYSMKDTDGDTDKARLTLDMAQVAGSSGNDQITVLYGEAGTGLDVWAQLQPPSGASTQMVQTASTNQIIDSKSGNDYVEGGAGNDIIYLGDSGSETIAGHAPTQADVLKMGLMTIDNLSDLVTDASDNSLSTAARAYDHAANTSGIAWADLAHGGSGNDVIHGQAGVDLIYGGSGNDTLLGGSGDDGLRGGAGDDLLVGGQGNDVLRGDLGIDTFKWQLGDQGTSSSPARDIVMDFQQGDNGDILDLKDLLQGESHSGTDVGNLESYLDFAKVGNDTVIDVKADKGSVTQQIVLQNVDLTHNLQGQSLSEADIIKNLLAAGKLHTD